MTSPVAPDVGWRPAADDWRRLVETRHGPMLINPNDAYLGRALALYGEFSRAEAELFDRLLSPGVGVIDAGANIGVFTLSMARAVGPSGRVLALEPQRLVFQTLCANLALNGVDWVDAQMIAVGAAPGTTVIPDFDPRQPGNFGGVAAQGWAEGRATPVARLDDLTPPPRLALIKLDVEGMESAALQGAASLIAHTRPALYVENDRVAESPALIAQLQALDYALWWHLPYVFAPDNWRGLQEDAFPGLISVNMLCLPREAGFAPQGFEPVVDPERHPLKPA